MVRLEVTPQVERLMKKNSAPRISVLLAGMVMRTGDRFRTVYTEAITAAFLTSAILISGGPTAMGEQPLIMLMWSC